MTQLDTTAYPSLDELQETLPDDFYGIARGLRHISENNRNGTAQRCSGILYALPPYKDHVWTMTHVKGDDCVTIINSLQYRDGRGFHDLEWNVPVDQFDKLFPVKGDPKPVPEPLPNPEPLPKAFEMRPLEAPTGKIFKLTDAKEVEAMRDTIGRLTARLDNATRVNNANDAIIASQSVRIETLERRIETLKDERVWLLEQLARAEGGIL